MPPKLSDELKQALAQQPSDQPLTVEDEDTQYVIIKLEVFQQMQGAMTYDDSEPDPREHYAAFAKAVEADVDAPGMSDYDDYDAHRDQS